MEKRYKARVGRKVMPYEAGESILLVGEGASSRSHLASCTLGSRLDLALALTRTSHATAYNLVTPSPHRPQATSHSRSP